MERNTRFISTMERFERFVESLIDGQYRVIEREFDPGLNDYVYVVEVF